MNVQRGVFIVLDGGEGGGKDTHIERVKSLLSHVSAVIYTREPGGTEIGRAIRAILLSTHNTAMAPETELLLFCAARAQLMREVVIPALKKGTTVVSNRFDAGTAAYQIYGRERHHLDGIFRTVNTLAVTDGETGETFRPSHYFLLDVEPRTGLARKRNGPEELTRFEHEALDFHTRVRDGFRAYLAAEYPDTHAVIDANRTIEEVWSEVKRRISDIVGVA